MKRDAIPTGLLYALYACSEGEARLSLTDENGQFMPDIPNNAYEAIIMRFIDRPHTAFEYLCMESAVERQRAIDRRSEIFPFYNVASEQ